MSDKNNPHIGYIVSLCGIMCGLALALMFLLGFVPFFEYLTPAAAGILIWVIRERLGLKYGLVSYIAVGLLCMLITSNYEAAMMFLFLLGYYPILREYLQKIRIIPLRWLAKLGVYTAGAVACYALLINLFGMTHIFDGLGDFGKYASLFLLGLGALSFVIYDIFLGLFKPFYDKIILPKIKKRMK